MSGCFRNALYLGAVASVLGCIAGGTAVVPPPVLTHGVAVGDVTPNSALFWARAGQAGELKISLCGAAGTKEGSAPVSTDRDFIAKLRLSGLQPGADYQYRATVIEPRTGDRSPAFTGRLRLPPTADQPAALGFAFGADVAGQNICRDAGEGFPIFNTIASLDPHLMIALGDMIYADGVCRERGRYGNVQVARDVGKATSLPEYWAHWRYVRADAALMSLLARVVYVPTWDDHEVVNDFDPGNDSRNQPPYRPGQHLMPIGLRAFMDYNPVNESAGAPGRIYRSVRWGRHAEFFILDTRQYRDPNAQADNEDRPKTMLGAAQLTWLQNGVVSSGATWKILVSSVPLAIPTAFRAGAQPDAWANGDRTGGFERELTGIVSYLHKRAVRNIVWLTGDVHMGAAFRYRPYADDPGFMFHEMIAGPLNAQVFGTLRMDETLRPERLFIYAPLDLQRVKDHAALRRWWNFGFGTVDRDGVLTLSLRNVAGEVLYQLELKPDGSSSMQDNMRVPGHRP